MNRDPVLEAVGPRLRALRQQRGTTLAELCTVTGISVSTLSRLESGGRRHVTGRADMLGQPVAQRDEVRPGLPHQAQRPPVVQ